MGFQPFGYRFEVISYLDPANTKKAIRTRKTGILDAKKGARGWIAGPFVCLWFSAFDRHGPMLFGMISSDNLGARVHGRAGSDLNGVLMFTLLIPVMAWLVLMMISEQQASAGQLLLIGAIFLVGGPLLYWSAHKERKDAEPLVRFLRKALSPAPALSRSALSTTDKRREARLMLNGNHLSGQVTADAIENAFIRVGNGDFLIIETSTQNYIQTASRDGAYILEARNGGPTEQYRAVRVQNTGERSSDAGDSFTFDEIQQALVAYVSGENMPRFMRWQPMEPKV